MPTKTSISWTDYSSNPLRYRELYGSGAEVWGCVHASAGCVNCYAERTALRFNRGREFTAPNMKALTPYLDEREMHKLRTSKKLAGQKVFLCDMTDLFGGWVSDPMIAELWTVFALRPDITFQVLTKRAERMAELLKESRLGLEVYARLRSGGRPAPSWPLPNVWCGVSAEDQQNADERVPFLLASPAAVRFVSAEPLIGPVNFRHMDVEEPNGRELGMYFIDALTGRNTDMGRPCRDVAKIDWVIAGGESGSRARPMHEEWAKRLQRQCAEAHVPFWFKQWGTYVPADYHTATHLVKEDATLVERWEGSFPIRDYFGNPTGRREDLLDRGHPYWARIRKTNGRPGGDARLAGNVYHEFPETGARLIDVLEGI